MRSYLKRCWLFMLVVGFVTAGYFLMSTSKVVRSDLTKIQEKSPFSLTKTQQRCRHSSARSEDQVLRCFEDLALKAFRTVPNSPKKPARPHGMVRHNRTSRHPLNDGDAARVKAIRHEIDMLRRQERELTLKSKTGDGRGSQLEMLGNLLHPKQPVRDVLLGAATVQVEGRRRAERKTSQLLMENAAPGMRETNRDQSVLSALNDEPRQSIDLLTAHLPKHSTKKDLLKYFHMTKNSVNLSFSALQEIEERFKQRKAIFQKGCQQYRDSGLFRPLRECSLVLPSLPETAIPKARYCSIPKTGSTTWERVLNAIAKDRMQKHGTTKYVRSYSPQEFKVKKECSARKAQGVTERDKELSFTFVREPYSRLLSAYVDKLFSPNTMFWAHTGRYIVAHFRQDPSPLSLSCGHDVTFAEFIRYVIHMQDTGRHREGHFVPLHDHCRFCNVSYDYIGHLETLDQDMAYLLHTLQSPLNISGPFELDTLTNNAEWVFLRMKRRIVNCISLDEAGRRLWKKWQIRGLVSKTDPFPFSTQQVLSVTSTQVAAAALAARETSGGLAALKAQKTEALKEAFATVSLQDRIRLRQLLVLDFQLFGFDPSPQTVFPESQSISKTDFSYFEV
ncbi:uncharacterized protein LOC143297204 isoform X1 [Babylonia areolata]|uniref:uncharacterized protein LOC143297204 isoform X1 n=1 Tax=Babylonia areolata TaxID=304850 RepID=UPI003FD3909C